VASQNTRVSRPRGDASPGDGTRDSAEARASFSCCRSGRSGHCRRVPFAQAVGCTAGAHSRRLRRLGLWCHCYRALRILCNNARVTRGSYVDNGAPHNIDRGRAIDKQRGTALLGAASTKLQLLRFTRVFTVPSFHSVFSQFFQGCCHAATHRRGAIFQSDAP
jgi:hypothetical protein